MQQQDELPSSHAISPTKTDTTLSIENILLEEYKYASTTAYQAIEDRARVINLYYVLLGIVATGLIAVYQFSGPTRLYSQLLVIIVLLIVSGLSFTFFINIIRLRQSFLESIMAMNVIKEFYIQQFKHQLPTIEQVFRWRLKTIPVGERVGSVTFVMSYLIALMGSLCLAAAISLSIRVLSHDPNLLSIPTGIAFFAVLALSLLAYTLYYRHSLSSHSSSAQQIEQTQEAIDTLP